MKAYLFFFLSLCLLACQPTSHEEAEDNKWQLTTVENPVSSQSGEPNLFVADQGEVYLSWIDALENDEHALRFAKWENMQWSAPQTIAQDSGWFVNWADFPSLSVNKNFMAAHWLAKSAEGTYDYEVKVALSEDLGKSWVPPFVLHRDEIAAEHGFVTMLPDQERIFAVWLDGRFTKENDSKSTAVNEHAHGGAMSLYATTFDQKGSMGKEIALDHRICDCCQTDAVNTAQGLIVVYRDRSENEVRDIYITRELDGKWTIPTPVFVDNWQIKACPVNGPAIAAEGENVAITWFTAAEDIPKVQIVFSNDYGTSFTEPVQIHHGNPLGRVDVIMLDNDHAMVSWLEATDKGAEIRAAVVSTNQQLIIDRQIANTADSRSSGFPIMEKAGNEVFFAWTDLKDDRSKIITAMLNINELAL